MSSVHFIVQMECGEDTRFLGPDADILQALKAANDNVASGWTVGTKPKVEVFATKPHNDQVKAPGFFVLFVKERER